MAGDKRNERDGARLCNCGTCMDALNDAAKIAESLAGEDVCSAYLMQVACALSVIARSSLFRETDRETIGRIDGAMSDFIEGDQTAKHSVMMLAGYTEGGVQ